MAVTAAGRRAMKLEGDYAVDKAERAHRIASAVVYGCWILFSLHRNGLGQAFKTAAAYLLPMACIWFPAAMASYSGVFWGNGRLIDERSHPRFLRWGGWFLLFVAPAFVLGMFLSG